MMVRTAGPERMLTDDERALLELLAQASPAERTRILREMVTKNAGKWIWEYGSLQAPRMYETRREGTEALRQYVTMLTNAAQVERDRTYQVRPTDG